MIEKSRKEAGETAIGHSRILLAEDDSEMRSLLSGVLCQAGYEITESGDGFSLLSHLGPLILHGDEVDFDLIISDIRLPGVSGMEVLEGLHDQRNFPPVILITAFGDEETHREAKQLGVQATFDKPFDMEDLLAKVCEVVSPLSARRKREYSPSERTNPSLQFPVDVIFSKNLDPDPVTAFVMEFSSDFARRMAARLNRFKDAIRKCRVVIDESGGLPNKAGGSDVNVYLDLPGKTLTVNSHSDSDAGFENLYSAIREAFDNTCRVLTKQLFGNADKKDRSI